MDTNSNTDMTGNTPLPNPYSAPTVLSWGKILSNLAAIPALPAMLFVRKPCIGFRRVKLTYVYLIAAAIAAFGLVTSNVPLQLFAAAVLGMGYVHNIMAWRQLCTGSEDHHTFCDGVSWLEYLPLPAFLYREERIYRFLDPIACYAVAALLFLLPVTRPLALVLAFSTVFLAVHGQATYEHRLTIFLDNNDNQVDALAMLSSTKRLHRNNDASLPLKDPASFKIPTGVGNDIRKQIENRKRRVSAAERELQTFDIIDNPAPEAERAPAVPTGQAAPERLLF